MPRADAVHGGVGVAAGVTEEGMRGFPARWGIDERDTAPGDDGENRV